MGPLYDIYSSIVGLCNFLFHYTMEGVAVILVRFLATWDLAMNFVTMTWLYLRTLYAFKAFSQWVINALITQEGRVSILSQHYCNTDKVHAKTWSPQTKLRWLWVYLFYWMPSCMNEGKWASRDSEILPLFLAICQESANRMKKVLDLFVLLDALMYEWRKVGN